MGRLFLLLVILTIAVGVNPTLRGYVQPHVQPALDPFHEWNARSRVKDIARLLEREVALERELPSTRAFPDFLERNYRTGGSTDPWGNPYYLERTRRGVVVGSPGRDGVRGTRHDVRSAPVALSPRRR